MVVHGSVTLERALEVAQRDEHLGICTACGEQMDGVEPDAHEVECMWSSLPEVHGAEELVLMLA